MSARRSLGLSGRDALARLVALPRIAAQPGVLATVLLTVLVATTLLSTGPVLATALAEGGLRADLEQADPADIGVVVALRTSAERAEEAGDAVAGILLDRLGDRVAVPDVLVETGTVRIEGTGPDVVVPIGTIGVAPLPADLDVQRPDELVERTTSVASMSDGAVPVLLHEGALAALGAELGDVMQIVDGPAIEVTGTLVTQDPADRRWWGDALWRDGTDRGEGFVRVGPIVPVDGDLAALVPTDTDEVRVGVTVRTLPRVDVLTPDDLAGLGRRARAVENDVDSLLAGGLADRWEVDAPLATATDSSTFRLAATRAAVVATVAQVTVLALYSLGLAGRLLRSGREVETMLVRARGATPEQLGVAAFVEGLVVVVPAVLAAPLLATVVVRVLGRLDVVELAGLTLLPRPSLAAVGAAAIAGIACLVLLVWPAVTMGRATYAATREQRGRRRAVTAIQASGADLALIVVAAIGVWQLRAAGGPVGSATPRAPGDLDPVLVVAPAIGLLAGAVLVLRLVPLLARAGERLVTSGRGLVPSLSGWQVARRPDSVARPTLLLVLGVAIGVLAATYATTWQVAQRDQARIAVGADAVVALDRSAGALAPIQTARSIAAVEGVDEVAPLLRTAVRFGAGAPSGTIVAVDAAGGLLRTRADVAPSVDLAAIDVPMVLGLDLPGGDGLELAVDRGPVLGWPDHPVTVSAVVRDGDGLVHALEGRPVPVGGATVGWDLTEVRTPVALLAVEVGTVAGDPQLQDDRSQPVVEVAVAPPTVDGTAVMIAGDAWQVDPPVGPGRVVGPALSSVSIDEAGFALTVDAGFAPIGFEVVDSLVVFADSVAESDAALPTIVHPDVLEATGRSVGDVLAGGVRSANLVMTVAGTAAVVPGAVDDPLPVLVDIDGLVRARWRDTRSPTSPSAWQLAVDGPAGPAASLAASRELEAVLEGGAVRSPSVETTVLDAADRSADPIAVGLLVALVLGAIASVALALLGTVTTAAVGVRERAAEFALLQAVGTSMRQIRAWLAAEVAVVVLVGLVAGGLLGSALVWAVLPTIGLATDGTVAVPAPQVVVPVGLLLAATVTVVVAFAFVPLALARGVARAHVAEVLRLGEGG